MGGFKVLEIRSRCPHEMAWEAYETVENGQIQVLFKGITRFLAEILLNCHLHMNTSIDSMQSHKPVKVLFKCQVP